MSAICGWFETPVGGDPAAVAHAMAQELPGGATPQVAALTPRTALIVSGADSWVSADGVQAAAVDGAPDFTSDELRALATQAGAARALFAAYERHGTDLARALRGAFAFILLDGRTGVAIGAVDRMGIRSLCYAQAGPGLVFGTSASAVARHPAIGRQLNPQAIFDYTFLHIVPSPRTVYAGISKLQLAEQVVRNSAHVTASMYWQPQFIADSRFSGDLLRDALPTTLKSAVTRAVAGERVGSFLSGGLDSSTVTGLAQGTGQLAHAYTIGFEQEGYDESSYARIAAQHFGADLRLYYVSPEDVAQSIRTVAGAYDEPFGNSSAIPALFCARGARKDGLRTLLAGDGGDELFGGNERYAKQKLFDYYLRLPAALRRGLIEPIARRGAGAQKIAPLWKLFRYVSQATTPAGLRAVGVFDQFKEMPATFIFEPALLKQVDIELPGRELRQTFERAPADANLDRMLYLDWKITLADNDLRKVNRMCEVEGIGVRYPMLDDEVVDLSTRIPARLKLRGQNLRDFFKRSFAGFLPRAIIAKRKHGFGLPFGEWLKSKPVLNELTYPALERLKRRGIYRPECIDWLVTTHREGHASYYGSMVWALLMLELWLEEHQLSI